MPKAGRSPGARSSGLTRDRVVDTAIEVLDAEGEAGLTFRTLALRLETGHGAIQWHVSSKGELMMASSVTVLTRALATPGPDSPPRDALHAIALGVFDAIDAHPWLESQLFAVPWQPAMAQLWEQIGGSVEELGVPENAQFTAVSTLMSFIVGVGGQNAMNTHVVAAHQDRDAFLHTIAERWETRAPGQNAFLRRMAGQLRIHDDRTEFLAGIDIILDGLTALRDRPSTR